jgi:hypothetical protein
MIYLVIILIVSQIIHFIHFQVIMSSTKRRCKSIDHQLQNLSQWVVSNQQQLSHHLEQINELVNSLYIKIRLDELKPDHGKPVETGDLATFTMLLQALNQESLEKVRKEEIQQYYALLLQELQQLDYKINTATKKAILESPFTKEQFFKNDLNNHNHWLNKNSSR